MDTAAIKDNFPLVNKEAPIAIIGTGDYARALSKKLAKSGRKVLCGSRHPRTRVMSNRDPELASLDIHVVPIPNALQKADVIFIALHTEHIEPTLRNYQVLLGGKLLIDISNPDNNSNKYSSHAESLAKRYNTSHIVKAFNTISAYSLESENDEGDRKVYIAANSKEAGEVVADIASSMGLDTVMFGNLSRARELEKMQKSLFGGWGTSLILAFVIFAAWTIYGTWSNHVKKGKPFSVWFLNTMSKVYGCTAMTLFPMCYLPGIIASFIQLFNCTKHKAFPKWLDNWMKSRKQIGLLTLFIACIHAMASVAHLSPAYHSKWYEKTSALVPGNATEDTKISFDSKLNWQGETAVGLAVLALATMSILGIASLPSVGGRLNWRQWHFIQSYLGYIALIITTAHVTLNGAPAWTTKPVKDTAQGMSFISLMIPYLTLFLRVVLLLPCLSIPLYKIRRGWEYGTTTKSHDDENVEEYKWDNTQNDKNTSL